MLWQKLLKETKPTWNKKWLLWKDSEGNNPIKKQFNIDLKLRKQKNKRKSEERPMDIIA